MKLKNSAPPLIDDPLTDPLVRGVTSARTVLVVRAVLAVAFGLVALSWPGLTVLALAIAFGIYAILEGVASVVDAVRNRGRSRWWWGLLSGLAGIAAGVLALLWPSITVIVLAVVVGVWALVTGATEIGTAFRLRRAGGRVRLLALAGVLAVVAGVLILLQPAVGAIGLAVLLGAFAVVYGATLAVLAVTLRPAVP